MAQTLPDPEVPEQERPSSCTGSLQGEVFKGNATGLVLRNLEVEAEVVKTESGWSGLVFPRIFWGLELSDVASWLLTALPSKN